MRWSIYVFAVISCLSLGGCGIYAVNHEANRYMADLSTHTMHELRECGANVLPAHTHPLDHRSPGANQPDCYSAYITPASRAIVEPSKAERIQQGEILQKEESKLASTSMGTYAPTYPPQRLAEVLSAKEVLGQIAWPAMLSNMVYRRYVDFRRRSDSNDACNYRPDLHPLNRLSAAMKESDSHWEPWRITGIGCKAVNGLFYETFVYREFREGYSRITHAFIVFRGTENYKGQFMDDWSGNLGMAFNIPPSQFRQVKADLPRIIKALKDDSRDVQIYTAGHSLGGSLAQLAAYLSADVKAAYVFNTSPVTGWTWLRTEQGKDPAAMPVQDPAIIRVIQEGEVLGLLRKFSNAANTTVRRTGRVDVALDFPSSREVLKKTAANGAISNRVALHSIILLACNIAARVAEGASGAFGFTKEMATALISENDKKYVEKDGLEVQGLCEVGAPNLECDVRWTMGTATCIPSKK